MSFAPFWPIFGSARHSNYPDYKKLRKLTAARKKPRPINLGRASLIVLPDDVILQILDLLQDLSPKSVANFARVSSYFYHWARYVQHRHVSIDLDKSDTVDRLDFISQTDLLRAIRMLEIRTAGQPDPQCLSCLSDLLTRMTGLEDIRWEGPAVGETILQSLQKCPQVKFHACIIDNKGRDSQVRQLLADLAGSTVLSSIRLSAPYYRAEDCLEVTQPLKKLLLSCPNLRKLSIDIYQPRQGCVVFGPPSEYCGLGLSNGERLPPLEELEVHDYPWGYNSGGLSAFNGIGYPEMGHEMDYWANTFDWSQLCRLEDPSFRLADNLKLKLTALKHVRFTTSWGRNQLSMQQFFEQVPSTLESICVPALGFVGIAAITRHGPELRKLEIHQKERSDGKWKDDLITDRELVEIRDALPHLEELGIDVSRDGSDWPCSTLDILASFPQLRTLTLWFELGESESKRMLPHLTMATASDLFTDLRLRSSKKSLQRLHVYSGCPPPVGHGWSSETAYWPESNSTSFVCEMAERDDDAALGLFSVKCPKLSKQLNDKAIRIVRGEEERSPAENNTINFRVALDGPMEVTEWKDLDNYQL